MAKTRIMAASILLVAMFVNTVAFGDDNVWRGVNTAAFYDYTQTPVTNWVKTDYRLANAARASDGYGLWSRGTAPGTGDTAVFQWDTTQTSVWGYAEADVLITNGFAPDHIVLRCTSTTYPDNANEAQISTSGEVSAQTLTIDFTASGSNGSNGENVFYISNGVFRLTGAENPVVFTGAQGAWQNINVGASAKLSFDAPQQSFGSFGWFWNGWNGEMMLGGTGAIEFPRSGAEISLEAPGNKTSGNIAAGATALRIRSDQTWLNPSHAGYVTRLVASNGRLVESLDGGALNNLSNIAFRVLSYDGASPYFIPVGTYQSLHLRAYTFTSGRSCNYKLEGDVALRGGVVAPGTSSVAAYETDDGLRVSGESSSSSYLELLGYDLTVDRDVFIDSRPYYRNSTFGKARITGTLGSTLTIGGDLRIRLTSFLPGTTNTLGALDEARGTGISGDATFTVNLDGSFSSNARAVSGDANLSAATVNLRGGTAEVPETWEVGNDPVDLCTLDTFSVGVFNVGTPSDPAHIRLVNDFLNDRDRANPLKVKDGEILVAGRLRIDENSKLDLNGLGLKVTGPLVLAPTATLDLNTGIRPVFGTVYTNVVGFGNQKVAWDVFAERVVDSSHPEAAFRAFTAGDDTSTPAGGSERLAFDGVDDYVEVPADGLGTGTISAFTVECWLRVTRSVGGWGYAVHRSKDATVGSSIYWLGVHGTDSLSYGAAVNGKIALGDTGVAIDAAWHHLAITYDGSSQWVYLDGVQKAGGTIGAISNQRTNNKIGIGSTSYDIDSRPIGGNIADVRVWNYARSAAEILAAKDAQLTGSESGLVGYWPLDEGFGTTVDDASANNNTGTLKSGLDWDNPGFTYWQVVAPLPCTVIIIR